MCQQAAGICSALADKAHNNKNGASSKESDADEAPLEGEVLFLYLAACDRSQACATMQKSVFSPHPSHLHSCTCRLRPDQAVLMSQEDC